MRIYSKKLSAQQTYQLVENQIASLPLFLRSILEQLRVFGNFEELSKYIDYFLLSQDISSLFEKILIRWETDYNTRMYIWTMILQLFFNKNSTKAAAHPLLVQDICSSIYVSKLGLLETEYGTIADPSEVLFYQFFGQVITGDSWRK